MWLVSMTMHLSSSSNSIYHSLDHFPTTLKKISKKTAGLKESSVVFAQKAIGHLIEKGSLFRKITQRKTHRVGHALPERG